MQGIVSLLDAASEQAVRALWAELDERFGLREAPARVPFPHMSYQIAEKYDLARLAEALPQLAAQRAPFAVRLTGLGAFAAPEPVLYLAVARNPTLDALHAALWALAQTEGVARGASPLYAPQSWIPHITLAQRDLTLAGLRALQSAWAGRDLRREVWLSDLALGGEAPGQPPEAPQAPLLRYALGGAPGAGETSG